MKFERTRVMNFEGAIIGMRNPLESWNKSDSQFGIAHLDQIDTIADDVADAWIRKEYPDLIPENYEALLEEKHECLIENGIIQVDDDYCTFAFIGPNDMGLAKTLIKGGSEHRKFLRQIFVSVDITAPLFYWKELDTYKIGTVANSTSTMHKLATTPITLDCFEIDDYDNSIFTNPEEIDYLIQFLEGLRLKYIETKDKRYWKELIRWLPESWLQTRTVTMNYENLLSMYKQRKNHKLTEWSESFCKWVESLPYAKELLML